MSGRKRKSTYSSSSSGRAKKRLFPGTSYTSPSAKTKLKTLINRTIANRSETKREYLSSGWLTYNHDAGQLAVVGAYGHPAATIGNNMLGTVVGNGKHQREGDAIFSKYIDYAIAAEAYVDRSATSLRILIVRGVGNNAVNYDTTDIKDWFVTDGTSTGSGHLIAQPVDKTKYTVLKDVIVHPVAYGNNNAAPAVTCNNVKYPVVRGRLKTNHKVQYITGSTFPAKGKDRIQIGIIPYCDFNAATTDNAVTANIEMCHYFYDM